MTDAEKLTEKEITILQRRVEYEDQLLNSRTGIVLTLNGLMAVAAAMTLPAAARIVTATVIIIVNVLWLVCSLDARDYLRGLHAHINKPDRTPIDEKIRIELQKGRFRISSTFFMSFWVPFLLLAGWIFGCLLSIGCLLSK